jgi:hypothetical protein
MELIVIFLAILGFLYIFHAATAPKTKTQPWMPPARVNSIQIEETKHPRQYIPTRLTKANPAQWLS